MLLKLGLWPESEWNMFGINSDDVSFSVPLPILVLGPNKAEHVSMYSNLQGAELCDNVTYLG